MINCILMNPKKGKLRAQSGSPKSRHNDSLPSSESYAPFRKGLLKKHPVC